MHEVVNNPLEEAADSRKETEGEGRREAAAEAEGADAAAAAACAGEEEVDKPAVAASVA